MPTASVSGAYTGHQAPGSAPVGAPSSMAFIVWIVVIGVLLPVAILGGLKVGGFSFVFRGR